jgi:VanZ family protein
MRFLKYHFPFIAWLLIIFAESSMPAEFYPQVDIFNADKILHICIYGLLGLLCYISLIHVKSTNTFSENPLTWTLIITSLYGASDELHQWFVPNRSCEFWDWLADAIGAIAAVLIIKYFLSKKMKLFLNSVNKTSLLSVEEKRTASSGGSLNES